MREKTLKLKIENILKDFALTFAMEEDDHTYWGHDTNLGDCKTEFDIATKDLMKLLNNKSND